MKENCLFCKIAAGEIPSAQVHSDADFFAFRDIHPASPSHILVIPRKHFDRISDVGRQDSDLLGRLFLFCNEVAKREGISENGFRTVINCNSWAGQEVYHLHVHVLGGRRFGWPPG